MVFLVALYLSGSPIGTWRSAQKIRYLYGHHYMALRSYYDITVGGPPELINWYLNPPKEMILVGGTSDRCLCYGGTMPCRRGSRELLALSIMWGWREKVPSKSIMFEDAVRRYHLRTRRQVLTRLWICWTLDLKPPDFRTMREKYIIRRPSSVAWMPWYFLFAWAESGPICSGQFSVSFFSCFRLTFPTLSPGLHLSPLLFHKHAFPTSTLSAGSFSLPGVPFSLDLLNDFSSVKCAWTPPLCSVPQTQPRSVVVLFLSLLMQSRGNVNSHV